MDAALVESLSLLGQHWKERECDPRTALTLMQQHSLPEIIARILAARGVAAPDAEAYLNPTLRSHLPDPFHLRDMEKAANRIADEVMMQSSAIAIFGDYDVDGATSSALLVRYFRALGIDPMVHIPDRMKEGYGPNTPALLSLKERGARLVITVDCGQLAFEPIAAATKAGLDVVVADHHKGDATLPNAFAVVNPNRLDEESPHRQLAAVGVVFLLLVAVNKTLRERGYFTNKPEPGLMQWLDIVALGTICDVVPLTGANRALVAQGLKVMRNRQNTGIAAAMDVARLTEAPDAYHAGFVIGPRINAGGRVGQADLGVRLLTTDDPIEAAALARELDHFNLERKAIEALALEEATIDASSMAEDAPCLIVARRGWHPGVIGVVAGRLKEKFNKPVAVVALKDGIGKASARSVTGIDLGAAVVAASHAGLLIAGGGHAMAAGFTVEESRLPALREFITARIQPDYAKLPRERTLWIDTSLALQGVTVDLAKRMEALGPFGAGNPQLRVQVLNVRVVHCSIVGDGHVRVVLADAGIGKSATLKAMAFRSAESQLGQALLNARGRAFHIVGSIRINSWQGAESAELFIDDARLA